MSQIKLNLIDSQKSITGILHAGTGDRLVAALSVEPETIAELEAGLLRFENSPREFNTAVEFTSRLPDPEQLDYEPFDAGILIIDLAARIVVCDSIYSQPGPCGSVEYHDGNEATDLPVPYYLDDDWLFLNSTDEYRHVREEYCRRRAESAPLDARPILYGRPMLEFVVDKVLQTSTDEASPPGDEADPLSAVVTEIHAAWLTTVREDLRGQSPRDVMLAKQDFLDRDLQSRAWQWSCQLVGPPCISKDSYAYRFAGFGTHEWVLHYSLVRHLIWRAFAETNAKENAQLADRKTLISRLVEEQTRWLAEPNDEISGHVPFILIDNERKRLPEAMGGRSMVIDEDCPICREMGNESEAGLGVWFYHLDGCNMDDGFAFSSFKSVEEWEADRLEREEFHREFDRKWKEREEKLARGEPIEPDPFFDSPVLDEFLVSATESEIPEA
jgi:hypothetical protein